MPRRGGRGPLSYVSETGITYDASKLIFTIGLSQNALPAGWKSDGECIH